MVTHTARVTSVMFLYRMIKPTYCIPDTDLQGRSVGIDNTLLYGTRVARKKPPESL